MRTIRRFYECNKSMIFFICCVCSRFKRNCLLPLLHKCFWGLAGFRRRKKEKRFYFHFLVACKKCIKTWKRRRRRKVERVKIRKVDVKREREIEVEREAVRERNFDDVSKKIFSKFSSFFWHFLLTKYFFWQKSRFS